MKPVTRDIEPESAQDLLERVPRACLSFASEGSPQVLPVILVWRGGRYLVSFLAKVDVPPGLGQEAVLLVDEGIYYFELRAIYIRGTLQPVEPPQYAPASSVWYELLPSKTVAWDYGKMRAVGEK